MDSKRLAFALVIIVVFMVVEIVGGLFSKSLALMADAGHMATDALAIGLALWARQLAQKPSSETYHFGHKRAQVLAAFVNGIGLFVLIAMLLVESGRRMAASPTVDGPIILGVATIGLLANVVAFLILHRGDQTDVNMRGAILHVIGDLLGSVAAIISAIVIMSTGWMLIDPIVTILVCILIGRSAWQLVSETAHVLLEGAPRDFDSSQLERSVREAIPEVLSVSHVHVWMLTPTSRVVTMRLLMPVGVHVASSRLRALEATLQKDMRIDHTTIQLEDVEMSLHSVTTSTGSTERYPRPTAIETSATTDGDVEACAVASKVSV